MASSGTIGKFNTGGNDYLIASTAYATCSTTADTTAKVATIQDGASFTLITGITINVKFTYSNTASAPTLNVNSTGALTITSAKRWDAGAVVSFTYDGTNWAQNDAYAELFECTIGTTTYAQITSALSAGQVPYLNPGGYAGIAWLSAHDDDVLGFENYEFTGYYLGNTIYTVTCWSDTTKGTNGWEANHQYFIGTTVIDENSTNDQIPTALAVYNALSSAGGGSSVNYEQITLNTSSWSSNQQTATVSGMTSTAVVWVNPTDDSKTYWTRANVRAISQATDLLTFSCTDQQLASYMSLNVHVIWAEPVSQS